MLTATGSIAPLPGINEKPNLVDIPLHLGRIKRFGGWISQEWTVLHHTLLTTMLYVRTYGEDGAVAAMMHDFHEYILTDIPSPVKALIGKERIEPVERAVDETIRNAMKVEEPPPHIKKRVGACDFAALIIESYYFSGSVSEQFSHIGTLNWSKFPEEHKHEIAVIIRNFAPAVINAMAASYAYNAAWVASPWRVNQPAAY